MKPRDRVLTALHFEEPDRPPFQASFTPEFAEAESGVAAATIVEVARAIGRAGSALATHVWRNTAAGNLGGWQVALNARVQSGRLLELGNVRLVGMDKNELQKAFKLRIDNNRRVFMWPQDIIDEFKTIESANLDEILIPEEAVEIVSELGGSERPANSKLNIVMLGNGDFKGGERHTIIFMVLRGSERKVVDKAQIMVKILGSSFRPLIFHASTDPNGIAKINLQFPNFNAGRAALLVATVWRS